jgi:P-type E1-E2 ATPase
MHLERDSGSLIQVGLGLNIVGLIAMDDPIRPEARQVVSALKDLRVEMLILTGDRALSARKVASALRIERAESGMTPEAKQSFLARQGRRWSMVGDGINDAPVLAAAGLGIAVGSATDLAREASGMVLPEGGIAMLPGAVGLSRAVHRTMIANLLWAFAYNAVALALAASGPAAARSRGGSDGRIEPCCRAEFASAGEVSAGLTVSRVRRRRPPWSRLTYTTAGGS